ncbi:MAG: hypothetical protein KAR20_25395 [Candidatus Heimdallarchaeota archaeon]|nr:hypothetical protein [Candidatus Heimdallarchaeota archaeon]
MTPIPPQELCEDNEKLSQAYGVIDSLMHKYMHTSISESLKNAHEALHDAEYGLTEMCNYKKEI